MMENIVGVLTLVLSSSAVTAVITGYFGKRKTAAVAERMETETDSVAVDVMERVLERLDANLAESREELRITQDKLESVTAQMVDLVESIRRPE
jgi:uncharacterized coiled-coil protein SlyX